MCINYTKLMLLGITTNYVNSNDKGNNYNKLILLNILKRWKHNYNTLILLNILKW